MKAAMVILIVLCLALSGVLLYRHNEAIKQKKKDSDRVAELARQLDQKKTQLDEEQQISLGLSSKKDALEQDLSSLSNNVLKLNGDLAKTRQEAKAAAEAAALQIAEEKTKITKLEAERDDLTKKMINLNTSITGLEQQISATQARLDASEGDKEFLFKELRRLQNEKAELERQFNDLAVLRQQVAKLREEISISRRLDWIRQGILGSQPPKGAEKLITDITPKPAATKTNFGLNVEIRQDGGAQVLPTPVPIPVPAPPK